MSHFKKIQNFGLVFSYLNRVLQFHQYQFLQFLKVSINFSVAPGIHLFKVKRKNTRTKCEMCSKLIIKTPENFINWYGKSDALSLRNQKMHEHRNWHGLIHFSLHLAWVNIRMHHHYIWKNLGPWSYNAG